MDTFFENFKEEINQIRSRSKKDNSTTIYRIQKSKSPNIRHHNSDIRNSCIEASSGVNLQIITKEGYTIYGSPNRVHVPDVLSRLYQTLENILKTNEEHRVQKDIKVSNLSTETIKDIRFENLGDFNLEFLNQLLTDIYLSISEELRDVLDIGLTISGNYSTWQIGNSKGGNTEFDDFYMQVECEISSKTNPFNKFKFSTLLSPEQIGLNNVIFEPITNEILKYADIITSINKTIPLDSVTPELLLLDETLTNYLTFKLINSNNHKALKIKANDVSGVNNKQPQIYEAFDKFGTRLSAEIKINDNKDTTKVNVAVLKNNQTKNTSSFDFKILRLSKFNNRPNFTFRNISVSKKTKVKFQNQNDITSLFQDILKQYNAKTLIYLCGTNDYENITEGYCTLTPSISLYFDGDSIKELKNYTFCNFETIKEIEFLGEGYTPFVFRNKYDVPVSVLSGQASSIKLNTNSFSKTK